MKNIVLATTAFLIFGSIATYSLWDAIDPHLQALYQEEDISEEESAS